MINLRNKNSTALFSVLVLALVFTYAGSVLAETLSNFDFLRFAREKVLTVFHPIAKPEEAESDFYQEPEEKGGVVSARVNIFYPGWFKRHSMLVQMDLKVNDGLLKVTPLMGETKFFKMNLTDNSWVEVSSSDWK